MRGRCALYEPSPAPTRRSSGPSKGPPASTGDRTAKCPRSPEIIKMKTAIKTIITNNAFVFTYPTAMHVRLLMMGWPIMARRKAVVVVEPAIVMVSPSAPSSSSTAPVMMIVALKMIILRRRWISKVSIVPARVPVEWNVHRVPLVDGLRLLAIVGRVEAPGRPGSATIHLV